MDGPNLPVRGVRLMIAEIEGDEEFPYVSQSNHEIERDKLKDDMHKDYCTDSKGPSNPVDKI